jgi:3'(2'), 5'-bisphosphate nucleotidase
VPAFDIAACTALLDELTAIGVRTALATRNRAVTGEVRRKADGSPVTAADDAAEALIRDGLSALAPNVPIVSEEHAAREKPYIPTGKDAPYFLVDPLDGTREFIAGRDEYTINIALIVGGTPRLGIIAAPALSLAWRGIVGRGAERIAFTGGKVSPPTAIRTRPRPARGLVIMVSRSHLEPRTRAYVDGFAQAELVQSGSAIKFCRIAEGSADLYPRLAPTHDWDVAAGHAIVKAAGGEVAAPDGSPLLYGTDELLIPAFVASGAVTA